MNIKGLTEFLDSEDNRQFFKILQGLDEISINKIQNLESANPDKPIKELLSQIQLQKENIKKIPSANNLLLSRKGAQQASSQQLAKYHADKFQKFDIIADLCCGIGIDLINLAQNKKQVYAVELDKDTLQIAKYNCNKLKNIKFINRRAEEFADVVDAIFIDPDRRSGKTRKIAPEKYSPPLSSVIKLRYVCPDIAVKLSPAHDYHKLKLPQDSTLEFVSESGNLKEILLCMGKLATKNCQIKAVLLPSLLTIHESRPHLDVSEIKNYLYEPDAAIIRAGLVKELGNMIGYQLIDKKIALLTGSKMILNEFGKTYNVKQIMPFNLKSARKYLREHSIGNLIIKTRGFPEKEEKFRKKFKLNGTNSVIMFIIRRGKGHLIIFALLQNKTLA
ncbi:MAG: class I SAM-dependent methyltransferase [Candidatus Cloacimonetes bacterium]|nr:class I SAM-dependent methyltransferase [Candidatus Cloacimonadota bacterium]